MGPAEGGEEVIQGDLVRHIQDSYARPYCYALKAKETIVACGEIEQRSRCDAHGVSVVVF